jgi:hypothetical protein
MYSTELLGRAEKLLEIGTNDFGRAIVPRCFQPYAILSHVSLQRVSRHARGAHLAEQVCVNRSLLQQTCPCIRLQREVCSSDQPANSQLLLPDQHMLLNEVADSIDENCSTA